MPADIVSQVLCESGLALDFYVLHHLLSLSLSRALSLLLSLSLGPCTHVHDLMLLPIAFSNLCLVCFAHF